MSVVDELIIQLGLDGSGAKKGMAEAKNAINGGISNIVSNLKGLAAEFAAAFAIKATWSAYTAEADAMGKLADAMGINIEKLHSWSEAAARAGGSSEAFQQSLQALNGQLVRTGLTGQSRAKMVLEGAGIDAGEIGRTREAFDVMLDLAEKAETMSKGEFLGLGRSLGLDTGTIMLLQQGRGALKDTIQAQKELGVYTKEDARVTADWNDRIDDSAQAFKALAAVVFREILPAFTAIVKGFNQFVSFIRKHETFVKAFFVILATIITTMVIPAFVSLATAILANPLTWVITAIVALAAVIEDLVVWAQGGEAAFGEFWTSVFGSPQKAIEAFEAVKQALTDFVNKAKETGEQIIQAFKKTFDWIISAWNNIAGRLGMTKISVAADISAVDGVHGGGGRGETNNIDSDTNINNINVYTQATDAEGISRDIGGAVQNNVGRDWAQQANVGVE